jgi:surface protein
MQGIFGSAFAFNQDLSSWDVGNVTNMENMFYSASAFNQPLNVWDTASVTNMRKMFDSATSFNQDINAWNVSNVTDMYMMFRTAFAFNKDLSSWDVSNVTNMFRMFDDANSFNKDLSSWDVSNVTDMYAMFRRATVFNQPLNEWDITSVAVMTNMFDNSGLSTDNYDSLLNSWSQKNVKSNVLFGANELTYCNGEDARQTLIDDKGWLFTGDQLDCSTASVDDQNQLDISIYPNPTSDVIYIDGNYTRLKVVVYDILGKQVIKESITNSVDISQLEKGVYILQLSDGAKLTTQRIIKK